MQKSRNSKLVCRKAFRSASLTALCSGLVISREREKSTARWKRLGSPGELSELFWSSIESSKRQAGWCLDLQRIGMFVLRFRLCGWCLVAGKGAIWIKISNRIGNMDQYGSNSTWCIYMTNFTTSHSWYTHWYTWYMPVNWEARNVFSNQGQFPGPVRTTDPEVKQWYLCHCHRSQEIPDIAKWLNKSQELLQHTVIQL